MRYLRTLAVPEARRLLMASYLKARTALQLSRATGIPIARCYKLLWRLHASGLAMIEAIHVTPRGRGKPMFRARLEGVELFLKENRLMARVQPSRILGY